MTDVIEGRLSASFASLRDALEDVSEKEALAFRVDGWPRHADWAGEDGSIAGLVWHVAAWKQAYLEGLTAGEWGDPTAARPSDDSWAGRLAWLEEMQDAILAWLGEARRQGRESITISGRKRTLLSIFSEEFVEHDRYHAAQVWYLRQRYRAARPDGPPAP